MTIMAPAAPSSALGLSAYEAYMAAYQAYLGLLEKMMATRTSGEERSKKLPHVPTAAPGNKGKGASPKDRQVPKAPVKEKTVQSKTPAQPGTSKSQAKVTLTLARAALVTARAERLKPRPAPLSVAPRVEWCECSILGWKHVKEVGVCINSEQDGKWLLNNDGEARVFTATESSQGSVVDEQNPKERSVRMLPSRAPAVSFAAAAKYSRPKTQASVASARTEAACSTCGNPVSRGHDPFVVCGGGSELGLKIIKEE